MTAPDQRLLSDEHLLDNAATASQNRSLLQDDDGADYALRECVRLNVVNPLRARIAELEAEVQRLRDEQLSDLKTIASYKG